jgi:polysaccharide biosynthesis/export protein
MRHHAIAAQLAILAIVLSTAGCRVFSPTPCVTGATPPPDVVCNENCVPHELRKSVLPPYVIEAPDVLLIEAIHAVPKQPYRLQPFDTIQVQVTGTPAEAPLSGVVPIGGDGKISLGPHYGPAVFLSGRTVTEAETIIKKQLATTYLVNPEVSVTLADSAARQRISGPHLVAMDGTVTLGTYGNVSVVGLTVPQAKAAVEKYLLQHFESLEISLEVSGYNSKVYYIVTQGAGLGDGVYRFPVTGNETVLDAICQINGLRPVSSTKIWVARPADGIGNTQRLEVNWEDVTANANARSNFQILPGDRIYVAQDSLIALDATLGKIIAPMERVIGFSILSVGGITRFSGKVLSGGGNANASF